VRLLEGKTLKLKELLQGIEILESTADLNMEMSGVCYDSRRVLPGNLFVAVAGYESDGHRYIGSAVEKGAACVLCQQRPETDIPYILMDNTRKGLSQVSANWFKNPAAELKIIGVTGTNGKTTTTNLIKSMLEYCTGAKVGLIGTNQNMIGAEVLPTERTTPESYELQALLRQMVDAGCSYTVMEVSSHALYLDRVYGIQFEIGIFTNLTRDHLDFHETMEEYGRAKAILFSSSKQGIVNLDDAYAQMMIDTAQCPVYTFSAEKDEADLVAKRIRLMPDGVEFCALTIGNLQTLRLGIPGMFSVYNGLAAMAALICLGIDETKAGEALRACKGVTGRAEVVPTGRDFTMIIDYAHTPDALENILCTVRGFATGRVVVLFGCGGDRDKTKRPIMGSIAVRLADFVIVTSDNPRTEAPGEIIQDILAGMEGTKTPYTVIENRKEAIGWSIAHAEPGDIIVLAGKGHETYQIIGKEKRHFDEREVIAEFLKQ
jgi:UDP-N-acetylmuramoyl-L-alanyl-D-glutamate--2,6-diaminopimelate ligase